MSQEEMIQAMAEGDREAFRQFYQETARPVYSFILSLTKSPYEAEDLMQETYLCVWTKAKSYVPFGKTPGLGFYHCQESLLYEVQGTENGKQCGL